MNNTIYLDSGYLDFPFILKFGMAFNFIVGGRGTGKTYGALQYLYDNKIKFIYMRRTQTQVDLVVNEQFNPFNTLNRDKGINVMCQSINKYNKGFYDAHYDEDKEKYVAKSEPIGYAMALSTISNLRGFDASDVKVIVFDEFIAERHERPIKNEADAFLNAYETMNRNRELNGELPIQVLFLANSNNLGNPLFLKLGLIRQASKQFRTGSEFAVLPKRDLTMTILQASKISQAKSETAIYRLAKNTKFAQMALKNKFAYDEEYNVGHQNLKFYKPIVKIEDLTIYKHKTENRYYVSGFCNGTPKKEYKSADAERKRFKQQEIYLYRAYLYGKVYFEFYEDQIDFVSRFET